MDNKNLNKLEENINFLQSNNICKGNLNTLLNTVFHGIELSNKELEGTLSFVRESISK